MAHCSLKFPHKQAELLGKLMPHKVEGPTKLWYLLGGQPGWNTQLVRTGLLSPGTQLILAMDNGGTLVPLAVASYLPEIHTFQGKDIACCESPDLNHRASVP